MTRLPPAPWLVFATAIALAACEKDACEESWTQTVTAPVTLDRALVHDSIRAEAPLDLCVGGGIYAYERYLFLNRQGEGYHLLDNSDPASPRNVAFLRVPGATQMAFVDGRMVSDSYADIVVLDFAGPDQLTLTSWTPNFLVGEQSIPLSSGGLVVLGYEQREVEFERDCSGRVTGHYQGCGYDRAGSQFPRDCYHPYGSAEQMIEFAAGSDLSGATINVAGSLSRFAFAGSHLYVVDEAQIATYALGADSLRATNRDYVGPNLETAVAREGYLYVGAQSGMHILDLATPGDPVHLSTYEHFTACDPVAVEGDVALVTLRSGRNCGNGSDNVLLALDISDRARPVRYAQVELTNPTGVALYRGRGYVCDGEAGLRVFDVAGGLLSELDERQVYVAPGREMRDVAVLPYEGQLSILTTGPDHVTQFAPDGPDALVELSSLGAQTCVRS